MGRFVKIEYVELSYSSILQSFNLQSINLKFRTFAILQVVLSLLFIGEESPGNTERHTC